MHGTRGCYFGHHLHAILLQQAFMASRSLTLQEARGIFKARKLGVVTPVLYHVDLAAGKIFMERIEGDTLKHLLHSKSLGEDGALSFSQAAHLNRGSGLRHARHYWDTHTSFVVKL